MKTKHILCTLLLSFSAYSWAGPSTGGGGFVINCPPNPIEPNGSAELLDLYEGRQLLGFSMAASSEDLAEDYLQSVKRTYALQGHPTLGQEKREEILENLVLFFRYSKFVNSPSELPQANDLGAPPKIPSGCRIEQVAYFDDQSDVIYILKPLFDKMRPLDQAALVSHELNFRHMRELKDDSSQISRRTVAHSFSSRGPVDIKEGLSSESKSYTASDIDYSKTSSTNIVSRFYLERLIVPGGHIQRVQFIYLHGMSMLAKTYIDLPGKEWNVKFGRSVSNINHWGCIVQTPDQDQKVTVPIKGSMINQLLSIQFIYKTGEPITFVLMKDGRVLSEVRVDMGCQGLKIHSQHKG